MAEPNSHLIDPTGVLRDALDRRDPSILSQLTPFTSTWAGMVELRDRMSAVSIDSSDCGVLLSWLWHDSDAVANTAKTVTLLLNDKNSRVELFERLANLDPPPIPFPFRISYDLEEHEFAVDLPQVPGWGVSHYGRDNPETDRLLRALEAIYAKSHPDDLPESFRLS